MPLIAASVSLGSPLVVALLAVLAVVELGLLAWALLDLARRPAGKVAGGSRLLWLLLCVFVQLLGPVLYLVVGRMREAPRQVPPPQAPGGDGHVARAAAALYDAAGRHPRAPADGAPADLIATTEGSGPAVELIGVRKVFRTAAALDGLSLSVPEGSVFGFLGPNGAGKTTTLRILAGLARPTSGEARVLGHDVAGAGGDVRAVVGFLPDVPAFYKWMTAPQYLRFAGNLFGLRGEALEARVAALLDLAGLAGVDTRIGGFSRGMKQRLGVAQALVNAPRLLLLDEPTSALDPIGRREVLDMIAALRGRTTVFFSTHILADVERVCDTVAIIDNGRVVAHAPIDELRRRRGGLSRLAVEVDEPQRLAPALEGAAWLRAIEVVDDGGLRLATVDLVAALRVLPALIARLGLALRRLESDELSLEDVFVDLVEGERR
ncbi:MAG: ATP-binding cassette domain-containing protein [Actinobacteria bacterium]|nr:ATP-binding cassette domain-containing protein [Actinomycetota bacterium]